MISWRKKEDGYAFYVGPRNYLGCLIGEKISSMTPSIDLLFEIRLGVINPEGIMEEISLLISDGTLLLWTA